MERVRVDAPLWDQSTFYGRFRHFFWMTNPLNGLHSEAELLKAKTLVQQYRAGEEPKGTTDEQVKFAMKLYSSAFHPDTGDLQNVFGRMSFQAPGGMLITGAMLHFYKSVPQVVFCQWFNQSFNALVNYTNRNAEADLDLNQMGVAYVTATFSALGVAVVLKKFLERSAPPMLQRFVPWSAVATANIVNLPLMRQNELTAGIELRDENGERACKSKSSAVKGIAQVVASRNAIMTPGMLTMPFVMRALEQKQWFKSRPALHMPFQVLCVGCFLTAMVPAGCALYPQQCAVSTEDLKSWEPEAYAQLLEKYGSGEGAIPKTLYFNKGL